MTGYSNDAISNDPELQGIGLLPKPFTESALAAAVHEALQAGASRARPPGS